MWVASNGEEIARLEHGDGATIRAVVFRADGENSAAVSGNGTVRIWLLQQGDLITEACSRLTHSLTPRDWPTDRAGIDWLTATGGVDDTVALKVASEECDAILAAAAPPAARDVQGGI